MRKNPIAGIMVLLLTIAGLFCSAACAEQGRALIEAAGKGDLKLVQELLDEGVDINTRGERGWTPLLVTAELGRSDTLENSAREPPHGNRGTPESPRS